MTFFLSGLYLLPESKKRLYDPPNNPRGASDIGYLTDEHVKATLTNVRRAWLEGHEIGTHFNGHFCGGPGTVGNWTPAAVAQRDRPGQVLRQGVADQHRLDRPARRCPSTTTRNSSAAVRPACSARTTCCPPPASSAGATTPPRPAAARSGRTKQQGIWDLPAAADTVPRPQLRGPVDGLQHAGQPVPSRPPRHPPTTTRAGVSSPPAPTSRDSSGRTRRTARPSSSATTSSSGTAASTWTPSRRPSSTSRAEKEKGADVRLVSFRQFVDWLDVQKPEVLAKLRTLDVGQQPAGGWREFTQGRPPHPARRLAERRLKCGFPPARGVRKIPRTGMRNFSHECRQRRPARTARPVPPAYPPCPP